MFELAKESKIKIDKNDKEEFPKLPAVLEINDNTENTMVNSVLTTKNNTPQPIYMMSGRRIYDVELKKIDPKDIEKMEVFKGEKAVMRYGEIARDGAIVITLKKK